MLVLSSFLKDAFKVTDLQALLSQGSLKTFEIAPLLLHTSFVREVFIDIIHLFVTLHKCTLFSDYVEDFPFIGSWIHLVLMVSFLKLVLRLH